MKYLSKVLVASRPFRARFGAFRGLGLWLALLKEKFFKPGEMFSVRVPGLKYPVFLRAKTSDIEVFCQIMVHAELDFPPPEEVRYIVDAGANIGLSSIFMALKFPGAVIDAVEVADANIPVLRKNTAFYPQINIYPMGLWFRSAKLKIISRPCKTQRHILWQGLRPFFHAVNPREFKILVIET